jgi:WYL domain
MGNRTNTDNWTARERLAHIERLAYWRGWLRRGDLCARFKISISQASADLAAYMRLNPGALDYNRNAKQYVAASNMSCTLTVPTFEDALPFVTASKMMALSENNQIVRIDLPNRHVPARAARDVIRAIANKLSLEIYYFSIHSATEQWRRITPHALAHDGYRWHVRGWCHQGNDYKDFVLGRIRKTRSLSKSTTSKPDEDWTIWVTLHFRPHHRLTAVQRKAIEHDYAMKGGIATLKVRKAMLAYTLAYLRLAPKPSEGSVQHLEIVEN